MPRKEHKESKIKTAQHILSTMDCEPYIYKTHDQCRKFKGSNEQLLGTWQKTLRYAPQMGFPPFSVKEDFS